MKNEATILPIFVAAVISVAVCLSLFWTSPVVIGLGGMATFCSIVKAGWSVSGAKNLEGISLSSLCGIWLLLALTSWFGWLCL